MSGRGRRRAFLEGRALHRRVAIDRGHVAELNLATEAAREVRPQEAEQAAGELEQPQGDAGADRAADQRPTRHSRGLALAHLAHDSGRERLQLLPASELPVAH
jgi:hypothetical protein